MSESKSLKDYTGITDPRFVHTEMMLKISGYESFVETVHYAIEKIVVTRLEMSKHHIIPDEEQISDKVVDILYAMNYNATRESSNNGNVDVTVELGEYKWLAEAKIYNSNPYLRDGYRQLTTRYSLGSSYENNYGGFLIYNFRPSTKTLLEDYKKKTLPIFSGEYKNFEIEDCKDHPLRFITKHVDEASGLNCSVKHIPFNFYFEPKDKSGLISTPNRIQTNQNKIDELAKRKSGN